MLLKNLKIITPVFIFICLLMPSHLWAQLREGEAPILDECKVTSVEQLLPAARQALRSGFDPPLNRGDDVLLVDQYDPWIVEAIEREAAEMGLNLSVVKVSMGRDAQGNRVWPKWFEDAFWSSDGIIATTGVRLSFPVLDQIEKWGGYNRVYSIMQTTLENFAYLPWTAFPKELDYAIQKKIYEFANIEGGSREFHLTDPGGTDLYWTMEMDQTWVDKEFPTELYKWDYALRRRATYLHAHGMFNPSGSKVANARGVVASAALHSGPIPLLKLHMGEGKVERIEGGGAAGENWKVTIDRYKDVDVGMPHGVGIGMWLEEVSIGTHPKQRPVLVCSPDYYQYSENVTTSGPYRQYSNWTQGLRRSGVMHLGFGKGWHPLADRQGEYEVRWHRDIEIYFPTLTVDGKKLIDNGYLTILDDPEIRQIAAKYGDPDELLRVEWIPPHWDPNRWW